jgi:hypothetical protein
MRRQDCSLCCLHGAYAAAATAAASFPAQLYNGGPILMEHLAEWYVNATAAVRAAGWTGDILLHDGWLTDWEGWRGFLAGQ